MDFRSGGWLIGGRPTGLLILGDHLFLNYKKKIGQWWLINRAGFINPHLALYHMNMSLISSSSFPPRYSTNIWQAIDLDMVQFSALSLGM